MNISDINMFLTSDHDNAQNQIKIRPSTRGELSIKMEIPKDEFHVSETPNPIEEVNQFWDEFLRDSRSFENCTVRCRDGVYRGDVQNTYIKKYRMVRLHLIFISCSSSMFCCQNNFKGLYTGGFNHLFRRINFSILGHGM